MLKMDTVEVVPEFGTIAMMIFAIVVSISLASRSTLMTIKSFYIKIGYCYFFYFLILALS